MRLEKLFKLESRQEVGLFVDAFNLTGFSFLTVESNPAGTWSPDGPNTAAGRFTPASTGPRSQVGVRTFRLSIRYSFN